VKGAKDWIGIVSLTRFEKFDDRRKAFARTEKIIAIQWLATGPSDLVLKVTAWVL
jgi:hypothetical protein